MISSVLLMLAVQVQATSPEARWNVARPDHEWDFPADHLAHRGYRTEWWYLTGHLTVPGDSLPRFGYQFTFFKIGLTVAEPPRGSEWATGNLIMGHAALTDLAAGTHHFGELLYRDARLLGGFGSGPDTAIVWSLAPPGTPGTWSLTWNGVGFDISMDDATTGFGFTLSTAPEKPLVLQGPNGFSSKGGPTSASLYYSFTRLLTTGTVRHGDSTVAVSGTSWMDKEFASNQLGDEQVGWDWFSIQLEDGRDLMLYRIRGEPAHMQATLVDSSGVPAYLSGEEWELEELERWTSPVTGATYPARWRITIPGRGLRFTAVPLLSDQENVSTLVPGLYYWEGAITVLDDAGAHLGRGFAELTGYGEGSRPAL